LIWKCSICRERLLSIGLDNHGRRYFDPEIGRYINCDPIGYGDGPNVYIYVQNNPINHIDPLGLGKGDALLAFIRGKLGKGAEKLNPGQLMAHFFGDIAGKALKPIEWAGKRIDWKDYKARYPDNKSITKELMEKFPEGVKIADNRMVDLSKEATSSYRIKMTGNKDDDIAEATRRFLADPANKGKNPEGRWHHHFDVDPETNEVTMLLVDKDLHGAVGHYGGDAIGRRVPGFLKALGAGALALIASNTMEASETGGSLTEGAGLDATEWGAAAGAKISAEYKALKMVAEEAESGSLPRAVNNQGALKRVQTTRSGASANELLDRMLEARTDQGEQ